MTPVRWGWMPIVWTTVVFGIWVVCMPPGWGTVIALSVAVPLWVFVWAFFRNPRRIPQGSENTLVAPGEGVVVDIAEVEDDQYLPGPYLRIGIFLSVFNVHVNRSPIAGTVVLADYRPGKFLDVRHPNSSQANEANTLGLAVDPAIAPGCTLLVRQLSGLIARRIVCPTALGDRLQRGQLYGMIRFGSRTELWIPQAWVGEVRVRVGDVVRVGQTPLATLLPQEHQ